MKRCVLTLLIAGGFCGAASSADVAKCIAQIKAAGPDAAGAKNAADAWRMLKDEKPSALLPLLNALDNANPVAANWLLASVTAITESAKKSGQALPKTELEAFAKDTKHAGSGRRLAFELLCSADAAARTRLLPSFLTDPAAELRYDAVQTAFDKLKAAPKEDVAAKAELMKLLEAARSYSQVEEIAKNLEERGQTIDLTDHFGFLKNWWVLHSFDNTDMKGFHTAYAPESALDRKATPAGKGGNPTKWLFVDSKEKFAVVDLNKQIDKLKNVVCYAYTEIESDADRDVELRAASATALKIFLNGKEVFARESYHQSFDADTHIAPAKLKKGKNTILMKICQNDQKEPWAQEWRYQLRITDQLGAKVPVKELASAESR